MFSNDTEEMQAEVMSVSVIQAQDAASVNSQVATARQFPRSLSKAKSSINALVVMDKDTATSCGYAVPRDGKNVTGPSVHLANIVAQAYGNIRVETKVVEVGEKTVTCQATAWDLETNYAVRQEVIRKITGKSGRRFSEDMIILTANAGCSIARRNAIFSVVPKPLWQGGYEAAQQFIVGDISDENKLNKKRKDVLDRMTEAYGITEADILRSLGLRQVTQIKGEEIKILIGYGQSIKDGDSTVDQIFFPERSVDIAATEKQKQTNRVTEHITKATSVEQLEEVYEHVAEYGLLDLYTEKHDELKARK
ncbi:hypothetical protein [Dyadobacter sandarakinus]|uniref:Uncharacterized protein n=1 Tax=Dyadobacter sandarakinus TaxID=2747268 RepID=A0ABX7I111_9BACT|nr:hypothetical protein [Dyadobacter sandarakinus]QRQ99748.1 hypothetical protein HWI92_01850 [Dyadobacter sandarakinus]